MASSGGESGGAFGRLTGIGRGVVASSGGNGLTGGGIGRGVTGTGVVSVAGPEDAGGGKIDGGSSSATVRSAAARASATARMSLPASLAASAARRSQRTASWWSPRPHIVPPVCRFHATSSGSPVSGAGNASSVIGAASYSNRSGDAVAKIQRAQRSRSIG